MVWHASLLRLSLTNAKPVPQPILLIYHGFLKRNFVANATIDGM
jgi:hypothetical protein